ncbi:MAG: ribose-phosphate pyrophosphokinase [Candidatus Diapherotrites archaeon]|nr:ribose-phosphate pyrophosphokinase [Candidatus Diapherotrites archaeon]
MRIFSGSSNASLAKEIAAYLNTTLGAIEIKRFSDGEQYVRFLENIRGRDVFLVQSTSNPVSENLMELLIMIDAAKRASAARITAVIPYYGYARQDRKAASREPITAKLTADLLETAGADRIITMDLHSGQIQGFFNMPVDNLTANIKLMEKIKEMKLGEIVVVAPDAGSAKNSTKVANKLGVDVAIINKARPKHGEAKALNIIGDVKGKNCVMFDDMIDTAGTICAAADILSEEGGKKIIVCASHGLFSGPAVERIEKCAIDQVIVTDTVPGNGARKCKKISVLGVSDLFGEAIKRIHNNESITALFE